MFALPSSPEFGPHPFLVSLGKSFHWYLHLTVCEEFHFAVCEAKELRFDAERPGGSTAIAAEEDKIVAIVKKDYRDDFLKWKTAKIKEEEEGESWKYEVDEEDSDFRVKISEIQDELAEEEAWEKGLVTLTRDDFDKPTEIWMHSKYLPKMKPIIKKTVEVNMQEKDPEFQEPLWKPSHQIKIWLVDKNETDARTAYQWASGK